MQNQNRILSIDIMRGFTLCLMLFVNDLYMPGVPAWLGHTKAETDGMGLADWVFPGFLFMVGLSIPYALDARKRKGDSRHSLLLHILFRAASLILIGMLILNGSRVNPQLTGMPVLVWKLLLYIAVFLVWNAYPKPSAYTKWFNVLKMLGVVILIFLLYRFKAGTAADIQWLETGWWGILGLIGWGYLVAALVYLVVADRLWILILTTLFFLLLNIADQLHIIPVGQKVQQVFGIVLAGNIPFIVLTGLLTGIVVRRLSHQKRRLLYTLLLAGVVSVGLGICLRHWFIISKILGTPSWGMICNGISLLVFGLIYFVVDIMGYRRCFGIFEIAGKNSLTTYLAPDVIYFLCWMFHIPLFFYKQDQNMWLPILGSLSWAVLMILFAHLLSRMYIRLKL